MPAGAATNAIESGQERAISHAGAAQLAPAVGAVAFAAAYFRNFVWPATPLVLWGDGTWFFDNALRLLAGQLPYRDYSSFLPPGTDLLYAGVLKALGVHMWVPALVLAFIAGLTATLMTRVAAHVVPGTAAALPGLIFAGLVLPVSPSATHHWWSTAAVLLAALALLGGTTARRVALAGALCGLAACFTQTKGALPLVAIVVYLMLTERRRQAALRQSMVACAAAATVFFALNAYFLWAAGLRTWWFSLVIFPMRYYNTVPANNFDAFAGSFAWNGGRAALPAYLFVHAVPLIYLAALLLAIRQRWATGEDRRKKLLLLTLLGTALLAAVAPAPSLARIATATPLAAVLFVGAFPLHRPGGRRLLAAIALLAAAGAVAIPLRTQLHSREYLDLPTGRTAFLGREECEEFRWVAEHTRPGDYFYGPPFLWFSFRLKNPAPVDVFLPADYTRPAEVTALVQGLETRRVAYLLLYPSMYEPRPGAGAADHLDPLRSYLRQNYRRTALLSAGSEVWERK